MLATLRSSFIALALLASLSACSNQPGADDAKRDAEGVAKNDLPSEAVYVVDDLKRENGWLEGQDYKIHYTYNLKAKVDYPGMIVQLLKESANEIKAMPRPDRAALTMQVGLTSMMAGMSSDVPDVKAELESYKQYPAIVDHIRDSPAFREDGDLLVPSVYLVTALLKSYGVQKGQPAGAKIPRQVTLTYRKTEKGWQKLS